MEKLIRVKMMDNKIDIKLKGNMLTRSTIRSLFLLPDHAVVGLWYEINGKTIGCEVNETGTAFVLPDEWQEIEFFVQSDKPPSRPTTPADVEGFHSPIPSKRAKLSEENKCSAKDIEWFNSLRQFALYYEDSEFVKRCVTPISTQIVSTYAHGSHKRLTVDPTREPIIIRNYFDKNYCVPAKVIKRDDDVDIVLLKAVSMDFLTKNLEIHVPEVGMRYMMLGLSNIEQVQNNLSLGCGSVVGKFDDELRFIGSSGSANGDSGAGIWSSDGSLIGMNILVKHNPVKLNERNQKQYTHAIGGSSVFVAASVIKILASGHIPRPPRTPIEE